MRVSKSSVIQKVCCNQYKGTQLPLGEWVTAPTPICCVGLIDCTVFLCWRETHCFYRLFSLLFCLIFCPFLFCFCPMLFTPEMRSSKYSSKWCGFLSCCLCQSFSACLFLPAVSLSFCFWFIFSLRVWFLPVFWLRLFGFFFFCLVFPVISGDHRAEAVWVVCLLLDGTRVSHSIINLYPGSAYAGHGNNISAPKWTLHLTLCVSFLLPRQLSALAELLRIEFMGMEHYYSFCCA